MTNFRVTTNGLYRNYRTNLNKNNQKLNKTMTGVETQRKFTSYAEDPAAASKAWRLRRSYWRNNDQIDNNNYIISKYETAYAAMGAIVDGNSERPGLDGILMSIEGISGTAGASRNTLGKQLTSTADSIVSVLNTKYGEEFVFAGADGDNLPFTWDGDKLLYRGVDVNTEQPSTLESFGLSPETLDRYGLTSRALGKDYDDTKKDIENITFESALSLDEYKTALKNANTLPAGESGTMLPEDYIAAAGGDEEAGMADYNAAVYTRYEAYQNAYMTRNGTGSGADVEFASFDDARLFTGAYAQYRGYADGYVERNGITYEQGALAYDALKRMANETTFVDIGIGMKEDQYGRLIKGSAFNASVSGLQFLGYGKDNNLASVMRELGSIFERADPDNGDYASEEDAERANELLNKLHDAVRYAQGQHAELSADAKYLQTNLDQLHTNREQLNTQITDVEDKDMADAITDMTWAQYCYNAALRIGTNILSQSLIDYMH